MARWLMLSYDAADELYDLILTENSVQRTERRRNYNRNDFRKVIIKILRTKKVLIMKESVKTTIVFLDPSEAKGYDMIKYWYDAFRQLGDEFKFVIVALWQYTDEKAVLLEFPDEVLNKNFQDLLGEVLQQEGEI